MIDLKTYNFDLNDRAFNAIKKGTKKIEIRVTKLDGSFDYSLIKDEDVIIFKNSLNKRIRVKVLKVNWYKTIEELLTVEGTKYTLSSTDDFDEGVKSIKSFNGYTEGMEVNGVYAIHIEYLEEVKYSLNDLKCISENVALDKYIEFRESVRARMEHPEWLGEIPKEGLQGMIDEGGKIWVYYDGDVPVCSIMYIYGGEEVKDDLELDIDYSHLGEIGPVFVNFDYLGHGLMMQMLEVYENYLKDIGFKHQMTTVHPDNIYCSRNMEKHGMKKISLKQFKRGPRNIYYKEMS